MIFTISLIFSGTKYTHLHMLRYSFRVEAAFAISFYHSYGYPINFFENPVLLLMPVIDLSNFLNIWAISFGNRAVSGVLVV